MNLYTVSAAEYNSVMIDQVQSVGLQVNPNVVAIGGDGEPYARKLGLMSERPSIPLLSTDIAGLWAASGLPCTEIAAAKIFRLAYNRLIKASRLIRHGLATEHLWVDIGHRIAAIGHTDTATILFKQVA